MNNLSLTEIINT